jgi:hopene-associated glycosyltransferase HpnB
VGALSKRLPAGTLAYAHLNSVVFQIAGVAALAVWLYLLLGRGGFWRMREFPPPVDPLTNTPSVTAIIPARNEEACVGAALESLASQKYAGDFRMVLVDDSSSDRTVEFARTAVQTDLLTIIQARPLPSGWTGKLWALAEGIREAERNPSEYLLFTDADIVHPSSGVAELVARAERGELDLVSWMVRLRCVSLAERSLIPAFVFFFFLLYPPAWIPNSKRATAAAAGGCILIRRKVLERIGGIECVRSELIDDCALAQAVKRHGGHVWLGLAPEAHSIRQYGTFGEIERMVSRTAYTQLRHSVWLLAGTVAGMALTYVVPPLLAIRGNPFGIAAWVLMCIAYWPSLRLYGRSAAWAPLLPMVAAFYVIATVHSAISSWLGRGGLWKGRVQDRR